MRFSSHPGDSPSVTSRRPGAARLVCSAWRLALLAGSVCGALLLILNSGFHSQAQARPGSATASPSLGAPAYPTTVDLRAPPSSLDGQRASKPFLHAGGQAELDQEKADAILGAPRVAAQAAAGTLTPSLGLGFQGIRFEESFCGCYPPDGAIAAGPNHLLGTVNTALKIWNKSGALLVGPVSLGSLLSNPNCLPHISDPFAAYDSSAGHFVVGALTYDSAYNSSICIAVTQTGDPTAVWYVYGFPVTGSRNLLDFPHAAIGSDAIYLAGNQYLRGTSFNGARVYAYNKSQMYQGLPAAFVYRNVGNNAAGHLADTLTPAAGVGVASTAYFIGADNYFCSTCSTVSVWKWSDPFGASTFTLQGGVAVTSYSQPPNAAQLGGSLITTNDAGNLGAHWYNGTVYGTHAIGCNPGLGTVACVQWYQLGSLDTGSPTLLQQGIISSNGQYRFFPNLAVDVSGDMTIGYAHSSSSDYAGVRYTGRLSSDPLGSLQQEAVLKAGETTVIYSARYGDYAGEAVDPDGCTVWHLEEYADSGSLVWGTWVGSFRFAGCGGAPAPTPTPTSSPSTATPTATPTSTATPAPATATPTPGGATPTPSPTATPTPTPVPPGGGCDDC